MRVSESAKRSLCAVCRRHSGAGTRTLNLWTWWELAVVRPGVLQCIVTGWWELRRLGLRNQGLIYFGLASTPPEYLLSPHPLIHSTLTINYLIPTEHWRRYEWHARGSTYDFSLYTLIESLFLIDCTFLL